MAKPGGNQLAGRRKVGQASHKAPKINPILPVAAASILTLAVCSNRTVNQAQTLRQAIATKRTAIRRSSLGLILDLVIQPAALSR